MKKTVENKRLPFHTLENHQQNVYNWRDVVQKDFFSVDFHAKDFIPALETFYNKEKNSNGIARCIEINQKGQPLPLTYGTACHAVLPNIRNSFLDVFLYRGRITPAFTKNLDHTYEEFLQFHREYMDTILSFSEENPWASAVTQLIVLRDKETEIPEAVFLPTVVNHPAREQVSNLFIAMRQSTEWVGTFLNNYIKYRKEGYSKRAAIMKTVVKYKILAHSPWVNPGWVSPRRFFATPSYWEQNIIKTLNNRCNALCWDGDDKNMLNKYIEKEKNNG
jgi:hypothetical protein